MVDPQRAKKLAGMVLKKGAKGKGQVPLLAVSLFLEVLQSPAVQDWIRDRAKDAPATVSAWSKQFSEWLKEREKTERLRPGYHFGQQKLERRVGVLRDGVAEIFPSGHEPGRAELITAIDNLETALAVAGRYPLVRRKQAHFRLDDALDQMERALLTAVLERSSDG